MHDGAQPVRPPASPEVVSPTDATVAVEPVWRTVHTALVLDARHADDLRVLVTLVTPTIPGHALVRDGAAALAWRGAAERTVEWALPRWVGDGRRDHEASAHLTA